MADRVCEKCGTSIPNDYINALCMDCYKKIQGEAAKGGPKKCERCGKDIPASYNNLLCDDCYKIVEQENKIAEQTPPEGATVSIVAEEPVSLFQDAVIEVAKEQLVNVSADYDWLGRMTKRFNDINLLIPSRQRNLYEKIRDYWIAGRTVMDIGCSLGVGSNILAHQARHVWGVDINPKSLEFAQQAFARPNLSFALLDIENPPTREIAPFEVVVCIEVIEHLANVDIGLGTMKRFFSDKLSTVGFITIPNIGNTDTDVRDANNHLHLHRWGIKEFRDLMRANFQSVTIYSVDKLQNWSGEEIVGDDNKDQLVVAKVEGVR